MATFRMRVFRYTSGGSDKVWAICRDGQRVLCFHGKHSQTTLNGGPIKPKTRDLNAEVSRRIQEQLDQGYTDLGEYDVEDKRIQWVRSTSKATAPAKTFKPIAYGEFQPEQVAAMRAVLEHGFEVREFDDRIEVDLPNATTLTWVTRRGTATMNAMAQHGAYGRLTVLAAAKAIEASVFDDEGTERTAEWLREAPELFSDIPNLRELAADLRLVAPPVKVRTGAARPALW